MDIHLLASQLLERLANSIHDRDPNNNHFCFSIAEMQITEEWLNNTLDEIKQKIAEY